MVDDEQNTVHIKNLESYNRLHKPVNPYPIDIYQFLDEQKEAKKSRVIEWYNENIDPLHNGFNVQKQQTEASTALDDCFSQLPVDLSTLYSFLSLDKCEHLITGNVIERLVVTLLNEEDNRISSLSTKRQVLEIIQRLINFHRGCRIRARIAFQSINERWIDEVYEADTEDMKLEYQKLFLQIKKLFLKCWKLPRDIQAHLLDSKDTPRSIQELKVQIIQHYAAIQFQSIIRGYLDRHHLTRILEAEKEEQMNEIRKWSIVIIQKVVRGFLARRTIIRSMKIRKQLPKELLQIAEKYLIVPKDRSKDDRRIGEELHEQQARHQKEALQHPDLWGFLSEIHQEMLHLKREIFENEKREDAYAQKFVEKVVAYRQNEFEKIWETFPQALQSFTKETNNTHLIGSLLPMKKDELVTLHYGSLPSAKEEALRPSIHKFSEQFQTKLLESSLLKAGEDMTASMMNPSLEYSQQLQQQQQLLLPPANLSPDHSLIEGYPSILSTLEAEKAAANHPFKSPISHPAMTHNSSFHSVLSPTKATIASTVASHSGKKTSSKFSKSSTAITIDEVALAMTKNSQESLTNLLLQSNNDSQKGEAHKPKTLIPSELISGPLVRKALQVTVQQEVSQQLNQLMHHNFHSKRLVENIQHAYGPESVYVKGEATRKRLAGGYRKISSTSTSTNANTTSKAKKGLKGSQQLQPLDVTEIRRQQEQAAMARKKKKQLVGQKGVDGKVVEFHGNIAASHQSWIESHTSSSTLLSPQPRNITSEVLEGRHPSELRDLKAPLQHPTVHPGHALLLEIPHGLEDSIERLVHAAALRCYVPDFFRGPSDTPPLDERSNTVSDTENSSIHESDDDSTVQRKRRQRLSTGSNTTNKPHSDPNYAYQLYLQLPMGLAKVKYELDCQRWSQGVINKLRVKGLNYLSEVAPVSKFMICLRNVDCPKVLMDKCVDLYLELKAMGKLPKGVKLPMEARDDKVMSVGLPTTGIRTSNCNSASNSPSKNSRESQRQSGSPLKDDNHLSSSGMIHSEEPLLQSSQVNDDDLPDETLERKQSTKRITFQDDDETNHNNHNNNHHMVEESTSTISLPSSIHYPYGLSKEEMGLLERASLTLQEILENTETAEWCNLRANIEELFIQAAFLIIPHKSIRFPHYNDLLRYHLEHSPDEEMKIRTFYVNEEDDNNSKAGDTTDHQKAKEEEDDQSEVMGNYAFKIYLMELFQLTEESQKVELIKTRFRAAVIFTSPFTLYLKSKGITTIKQLLTVDLTDLQLPKPLFIQLEIMINVIISAKIVKATLLSVPRDLQTLEPKAYYTPMYYDQKFQRTPLDPYGRPIGLGITQVKERLKQQEAALQARQKQRVDELDPLIEADLEKEISIWVKQQPQQKPEESKNASSVASPSKASLLLQEANHQFDFMMNHMNAQQLLEVKQLFPQIDPHFQTEPRHPIQSGGSRAVSPGEGTTRKVMLPPIASSETDQNNNMMMNEDLKRESVSSDGRHNKNTNTNASSRNRQSRQTRLYTTLPHAGRATKTTATAPTTTTPLKMTISPQLQYDKQHFQQPKEFGISTHPLIDPVINQSIFSNTYICHYPHCGQIFSRLYTYKVHLRTHENFPEYYHYKRQPQLSYD